MLSQQLPDFQYLQYRHPLFALAALSVALAGNEEADLAELRTVPGAIQSALELEPEAERIAGKHALMEHCVVLSRAYNYATAQEWALKLKELAYVFTDVYSTADFRHGPIAIVEPGFPVLAVAPEGVVLEDQLALLQRLRDEYRAELILISNSNRALSMGAEALHLPPDLPEWLTPIVSIVPAQLFCYHLTRAKGYDTEKPRTLHKITLTR